MDNGEQMVGMEIASRVIWLYALSGRRLRYHYATRTSARNK